jgi:hypothetical protein
LWIQFWNWMQWCAFYSNLQCFHSSLYPASRILWRNARLEYLRVLLAKHDGQAVRMWPSGPKTISSWISQAREDIKESIEAKRVF